MKKQSCLSWRFILRIQSCSVDGLEEEGNTWGKFNGPIERFAVFGYEKQPGGVDEFRNPLVVRVLLEGTNNRQARLGLRNNIVDEKLTTETILEKTLQMEAFKKIRKGENPKLQSLN